MNRQVMTAIFLAAVLLVSARVRADMLYDFRFEDEAGKKSLSNTGTVKGQAKEMPFDGPAIEFTRKTPSGSGMALRFPMSPAGTSGPAIVLPDSESRLALGGAEEEITIAMWVRWDGPDKVDQNVFQALVAKLPTNHADGWAFGIRDTGALRFMIGGMGYRDSKTLVTVDTWTHVAMVFRPRGGLRLFINGKDAGLDQELGAVTVKPNKEAICVGNTSDKSLPSNAAIDDLRLYDEVIASDDIELLMSQKAAGEQKENKKQ